MIVLYNLSVVLAMALVVKLGITFTDYEEVFVALGVLDIIYLICIIIYMAAS